MIVQLTGTLEEATGSSVVLDVAGVGYELGVSHATLADLPARGTPGVTLFVRMRVTDAGPALYGFSTREERTLFDRLIQVSGVGPKMALSVLSSFRPRQLAEVAATQDLQRLTSVPGVGKKSASRLMVELEGIFSRDPGLKSLAASATLDLDGTSAPGPEPSVLADVVDGLLSMGFSPQEAELACEGLDPSLTVEQALGRALKRLGGRA